MGNVLFGVDIAGIVADAIGPGLLPVFYEVASVGAVAGAKLTDGKVTTYTPCSGDVRGIWEDVTPNQVDGERVKVTDRIALIIGNTLPPGVVPKVEDRITIEGQTLYATAFVGRDPAAAAYRMACRAR